MENQRWMVSAFMQYLAEAKQDPSLNTELLGTVQSLLSEAYSIDLTNAATLERYPTNGLSMPDVYIAGRTALLGTPVAEAAAAEGNTDVKGRQLSEDDLAFEKFVKRLKRTTNFFGGVEEGSEEYNRRLERARTKFDERRKEKKAGTTAPATGESSAPKPEVPSEVSPEVKAEADSIKLAGNTFLKAKDFDKAVECYTKCIALDGNNAIYYGNRAAAKMHLKQFSSAVDDCKMAISIDKSYVRAHERLASAYRSLGMDGKELEALQTAAAEHPSNEQISRLLSEAQNRKAAATRAPPAGADGLPGFPGMEGLGGGGAMPSPEQMASMAQSMGLNISPELVQNFMASPMGAQMQSALRGENPAMAQMMQQGMEAMKNNPDALQEQMKAMLGDGVNPPGPGGNSA